MDASAAAPFGTRWVERMTITRWADGRWDAPALTEVAPISLHPAAHVLHYGSACFEGLKAHRGDDGRVRVFRLDAHAERLRRSAAALGLPVPPVELVRQMVVDVVRDSLDQVPAPPGSLYLRPTIIGTEANIGAAGHPAAEVTAFVLASPVGDYFTGGGRPLAVAIETERPRTTPHHGGVKAGANYVLALGVTLEAQERWGVDQVLFAPGGDVQETGASNVVLIDGDRLLTPARTPAFLSGVTLDSLLQLAPALGLKVEERPVEVADVLEVAGRPDGEIALAGTAAVLAGVGELVHEGERITVGTGAVGPRTTQLRQALADVQRAAAPDPSGWLLEIG